MMNIKIISQILFALVLQTACEDEGAPPPIIQKFGSLSGTVIDSTKGLGYEGAVVISLVNQVTDTTDEAGAFFLDSLMTGTDSILVLSEIHDSLITVLDINEGHNEFSFTPERLPCFNGDRPAEDTARVYIHPESGRILELDPFLVFARFDTSIKDSIDVLELISKYGLKVASEGIANGLNAPGWSGYFCSTVGLRAEYYFTPYGRDNFCNFGADPLVDYSFGVFDGGSSIVIGTIGIFFLNGTPEATAHNLIESYDLRFLRRISPLQGDDFGYETILTKKSKKNVLDLGTDLENDEHINFIIMGILSGNIGLPTGITCD